MVVEDRTVAIRPNVTVMQRAATAYTLVEMRERVEQLDAFYRGLMQKGTDYDEIPGTNKPTLLQPGAQLACTYFGFAPTFEVLPASVEDWERGFFALTVRCRLMRQDGSAVSEGIGSCNSKEDKYRWRDQQPQCPACSANTLRRGSAKFGGGYYCAAKSGGCGANFKGDTAEAAEIARQPAGRIENPEPWSLHNTILKMAEKRAMVAATLNATGASRIFTQDVEDLPEFSRKAATGEASGPAAMSPEKRQKLVDSLARGIAVARELGIDADDIDTTDMPDAELVGTVKGLGEMVKEVRARLAEQAAAAEAPPVEADAEPDADDEAF